ISQRSIRNLLPGSHSKLTRPPMSDGVMLSNAARIFHSPTNGASTPAEMSLLVAVTFSPSLDRRLTGNSSATVGKHRTRKRNADLSVADTARRRAVAHPEAPITIANGVGSFHPRTC